MDLTCVAANQIRRVGIACAAVAGMMLHTPPVFTTHPADITVVAGHVAAFTVAAAGHPAPSYQWQMSTMSGAGWEDLSNSATFSGVTSSTLAVTASARHANRRFRAIATNGMGSTASAAARLQVQTAPTFISPPGDQFTVAGHSASFMVLASGEPPPSFQWQVSTDGGKSWANLSSGGVYKGVNATLLILSGVPPALSGHGYRVVASNPIASTASPAGGLTVYTAPSIVLHPTGRRVMAGRGTTFAVTAAGVPTPNLRWQRLGAAGGGWSNLSDNAQYRGTTSPLLTVVGATADMSGARFRVVASNIVGSVVSGTAVLTVHTPAGSR